MRAAVYNRYGPAEVLGVEQIPEPRYRAGVARVRVVAAALNPKDVLIRKGKMRWLGGRLPRTPGYDVAGTLLDPAGGLPAGSEVFGMIQDNRGGGCAEIAALPSDQLARKPDGIDMIGAASLPLAGLTALQAIRDRLGAREGDSILINGASGGVGTLAVQVAKAMGLEVTAVCSERNADLVRDLGADTVVDYTTESVADQRGYDCVFDVFGSLPWQSARRVLLPAGRYCTTIPRPGTLFRGMLQRVRLSRAGMVIVRSNRADLDVLRGWVERGRLRPVIDRVLPLERSKDAHLHLETRRTRGKVVLCVDPVVPPEKWRNAHGLRDENRTLRVD